MLALLLGLALAAGPLDGIEVERDLVYGEVEGRRLVLDVYRPRAPAGPRPVLLFMHGGGWVIGSKQAAVPEVGSERPPADRRPESMLPFLRRGLAVVSVGYRLAREARAPAAVDDCRRALAWVRSQGAAHGLDVGRIVTIGPSAGGHLALMLALGERAGVRGAVDLFGITDVVDVVEGPNVRWWATEWIPPGPERLAQARALSPLTHVRPGAPPILIVHGDRDDEVPYAHALRLRDALVAARSPVELVTVAGGGHGFFGADERARIEARIVAFLVRVGMLERADDQGRAAAGSRRSTARSISGSAAGS